MSFWYGPAVKKILSANPALDLDTDTLKAMLTVATHVADRTDEFVDDGEADDALDGEPGSGTTSAITNYNGSGDRVTLGSKTVADGTQGTNGVSADFDAADAAWTALGSGATFNKLTVIKEIGAETANPVIINSTFTATATNGGDYTVQFASGGIGYIGV